MRHDRDEARSARVPTFAAIDFETADEKPDSACAVGTVVVRGRAVVMQRGWLIRPPRRRFLFTSIHGIAWSDVAEADVFSDVWPEVETLLSEASFLAAHNASFDQRVLQACCHSAGFPMPQLRFLCTRKLASRVFGPPAGLARVCERLGIPLEHHHEAAADAEACARIVLAAVERTGRAPTDLVSFEPRTGRGTGR